MESVVSKIPNEVHRAFIRKHVRVCEYVCKLTMEPFLVTECLVKGRVTGSQYIEKRLEKELLALLPPSMLKGLRVIPPPYGAESIRFDGNILSNSRTRGRYGKVVEEGTRGSGVVSEIRRRKVLGSPGPRPHISTRTCRIEKAFDGLGNP
ncbi:hypothetical protein Syun_006985 [Stephania yunnanensis]|uniref:Uncharacterized protein n=1 Tax=Stephania yunnanensis TaxID=152371 RepID=A0AAP0PZV5_9MAGN